MDKHEFVCAVVFVGSNPSSKNTNPKQPFTGTRSDEMLSKWISLLDLKGRSTYKFNVSDLITENNRPLKESEYQLEALELSVKGYEVVVALGNTAEQALKRLNIPHFKLPHPSPRNLQLNNPNFVDKILKECKDYISLKESEAYERFQSNSNQDLELRTNSQSRST